MLGRSGSSGHRVSKASPLPWEMSPPTAAVWARWGRAGPWRCGWFVSDLFTCGHGGSLNAVRKLPAVSGKVQSWFFEEQSTQIQTQGVTASEGSRSEVSGTLGVPSV